jgi:hypothetical protein
MIGRTEDGELAGKLEAFALAGKLMASIQPEVLRLRLEFANWLLTEPPKSSSSEAEWPRASDHLVLASMVEQLIDDIDHGRSITGVKGVLEDIRDRLLEAT